MEYTFNYFGKNVLKMSFANNLKFKFWFFILENIIGIHLNMYGGRKKAVRKFENSTHKHVISIWINFISEGIQFPNAILKNINVQNFSRHLKIVLYRLLKKIIPKKKKNAHNTLTTSQKISHSHEHFLLIQFQNTFQTNYYT